jgi:hypothetical protein
MGPDEAYETLVPTAHRYLPLSAKEDESAEQLQWFKRATTVTASRWLQAEISGVIRLNNIFCYSRSAGWVDRQALFGYLDILLEMEERVSACSVNFFCIPVTI